MSIMYTAVLLVFSFHKILWKVDEHYGWIAAALKNLFMSESQSILSNKVVKLLVE